MRERRWESEAPLSYDELFQVYEHLRELGLPLKGSAQEAACYIDDFLVHRFTDIDRLDAWQVDEVTLVQVNERWEGDFFVLAGNHHDLYLQYPSKDTYLSLSYPWRIPDPLKVALHQTESMFWIGFRESHAFVRVRLTPHDIITPGERRGDARRLAWMTERASAFSAAIEALDLPLFVEWKKGALTISSEGPESAVSCSWPDAFGPCQFEYIVADRYALLVPAARLVSKMGQRPAKIRTFFSGFPPEHLDRFHQLQPESHMFYRGYVHAALEEMPQVIDAIAPKGRALISLCEFRTRDLLPDGEESYAVIGAMGGESGYKIEVRLNRAPLPEGETERWLHRLFGMPFIYSPLALY